MIEKHLAHIITNRAKKYGSREAYRVKTDGVYKSVSWLTFKEKIDCITKFLISEGIGTLDNIGIYSENYPEWTICDYGILSARAVVVPIYATSTYSQVAYIVEETEMQIMCVGDQLQLNNAIKALDKTKSLKKIITFNCPESDDDRIISIKNIYSLEFDNKIIETKEKQFSEASYDDLATIIYTSGTTGIPKGVLLNHSNFIKLFEIHNDRLDLGEKDISVAFLPLSHAFERAWTYYVFYRGAINVFNVNPKEIIHVLPQIRPTVMCAVPRFFEKTYDGITQALNGWSKIKQNIFNWSLNVGLEYIEYQKDSKNPPLILNIKRCIANALVMKKIRQIFGGNIKFMPCAGAAIDPEILKFFHAMGIFVNYGYGATETTATVSCMKTDKYDFVNSGSIMPDVEVKINPSDGMILIKGETVFKGYYKKPKETEECLIDGWYYSGDLGLIPKEGTLLMQERLKDIIKTSTGKYISPQKIELILSRSSFIEQLCVIGDNRKHLTALIVPAFEKIKKLTQLQDIEFSDNKALISSPLVKEIIQKEINELQAELPSYEKVAKFSLLPEAFTIDNTMLTNSLKIRRKQVNIEYADLIKEMYTP
ncbi:MAG: long-chain fatty acid--CoA ligase [Bacteroidales bacterium]|nr:long-chain fatty acid--CoA ligase [Bacteroidales bacterium]